VQILDSIGEDERGNVAIGLMAVEEAGNMVGHEGGEFEGLNDNRQSMLSEEVDPTECHDPLPVDHCPDEDQDLIFTTMARLSTMATAARRLVELDHLIMDPIRAMDDVRPSEMGSSLQLSGPEDELCHDAWHVFMIGKALRASVANGGNSLSPMVRAFERFLRRPLPDARKLYRRLIRPMRRACMPLGDLFSRVYEVSN
jgi:hypothetical protein